MDKQQAFFLHRKAAETGCIYAMSDLATLDYGIPVDEYEKLRFLERAAEAGYDAALYHLAVRFLSGDNYVIQDEKKGVELLKSVSLHDCIPANYMLFKCYYSGTGVCKNVSLAVKYLERAAVLGDKNAKKILKKIQSSG